MIIVYNALLILFCLLLLPLILTVVLGREKYRGRIVERLGLGLKIRQVNGRRSKDKKPVIWLHALSVGEVTSALPLVKGLRKDPDAAIIVLTVATRSGKEIAESLLNPYVDCILSGPLDFRFAVRRYLGAIQPDLFILVETDFWPNWLHKLKQQDIPIMLVNGRVSARSFAAYTRFSFFFKPMFRCFDLLSMQTAADRAKMIALGIPTDKVVNFGNLKYDMPRQSTAAHSLPLDFPARKAGEDTLIWVCGSTHAGEEELLLNAYTKLQPENLLLIIAPRDISRGAELVRLARKMGLASYARSKIFTQYTEKSNVLILDSIGELAVCYSLARLAFIGGSLVARGGHNPIEAALHGVPVLFGPHMEDFSEIARDLVAEGGARTVSAAALAETAAAILDDTAVHAAMSKAARDVVEQHRGVVNRHLQAVRQLLAQRS